MSRNKLKNTEGAAMQPGCTLSINVARTDVPFMMMTIPHLVRMCGYDFKERMLIVDTTSATSLFKTRPAIGTVQQLLDCCQKLKAGGVIDSFQEVNMDRQKELYKKYFGAFHKEIKSYRGCPIFHYIFAIEQANTDYFLHFDSDILLFQTPEHNFIDEAIGLINNVPEIMCVLPLPGPPRKDRILIQRHDCQYQLDPRGFYAFKEFTARKSLISKRRLEEMLPIKFLKIPLPVSRRIYKSITGQSNADRWESMITHALRNSKYIRADLNSPDAWTLHIQDRGERMVEELPDIIRQIEAGRFPDEQAGNYDLNLNAYKKLQHF